MNTKDSLILNTSLNFSTRNLESHVILSVQAIKPVEQERFKQPDQDHSKFQWNCNSSIKTLTTRSSEKASVMCVFCKRHGHTLHKCCKIMERPVEERLKFVQSEKLCFGCLKVLRLVIALRDAPLGVCVKNVKGIIQRAYIRIGKKKAKDKELDSIKIRQGLIKTLQTEQLNHRGYKSLCL